MPQDPRPAAPQPVPLENLYSLLERGGPRPVSEQVIGQAKGAATGLWETAKGLGGLAYSAVTGRLPKQILYETPKEAYTTARRETQEIASRPPYWGQTAEIVGRAAATPFEMIGIPATQIARDVGGGIADIVAEQRYGVRPEEEGKLGRGVGLAGGVGAATYGIGRVTQAGRARVAEAWRRRPAAPAAGAQAPPPGPPPPGAPGAGVAAEPRVVEGEIVTEEMTPYEAPPPPPPRPRFVAPEGNVPSNLIINGKRVKETVWDPEMRRHRLVFEDGTVGLIDHERYVRESQRQWYRGPARQTGARPEPEPPIEPEPPAGGPGPEPPPPPGPTPRPRPGPGPVPPAGPTMRPPGQPPPTAPQATVRPPAQPVVEPVPVEPPAPRTAVPPVLPAEPIVEAEVPLEPSGPGLPPSSARMGKTTKGGGEGYPQIPMADVTDVERVELAKMLVAMESSEFTPHTWNWDPSGVGAPEIVGGGGGHPVYEDIVGSAANPVYGYSRKAVEDKLRQFLTTGKRNIVSDLALDRLRSGQGHAAQNMPVEYTDQYVKNIPREMERAEQRATPDAMRAEFAAMPDDELTSWVRMFEPMEGEAPDPTSQLALQLAREEAARRQGAAPSGPPAPAAPGEGPAPRAGLTPKLQKPTRPSYKASPEAHAKYQEALAKYEQAVAAQKGAAGPEPPAGPLPPETEPLFARTGEGRTRVGLGDEAAAARILASSLYQGDIAPVATKELLQNAMDAVRSQGDAGVVTVRMPGYYDRPNFVEVQDTGRGMTRGELDTVFTNLFESGKRAEAGASGGFGVAKASFLLGGTRVALDTVVDEGGVRLRHSFDATPGELVSPEGIEIKTEVVSRRTPTGTRVRTELPDEARMYNARNFVKDFLKQSGGLPGTVRFFEGTTGTPLESSPVSRRAQYLTYDRRMVTVPGAQVSLLVSPTTARSTGVSLQVLNNGIYQFPDAVSTIQPGSFNWNAPELDLPDNVLVDIRPTVPEGDPNYPFTANRESLRNSFETELKKALWTDLVQPRQQERTQLLQDTYDKLPAITLPNGSPIHILDVGKRLTDAERDGIFQVPAVTRLVEAMRDVLENVIRAVLPEPEKIERVGVLLDNKTHGVFIPNPQSPDKSTILINPFERLVRRPTPKAAASGMVHTVIHESVHEKVKGHDEDFTMTLGEFMAEIGADLEIESLQRLKDAYSDPAYPGQLDPELANVLQLYQESRGRDIVEPDILSGTGRHLRGRADEPGGQGTLAFGVGPGGTGAVLPGEQPSLPGLPEPATGGPAAPGGVEPPPPGPIPQAPPPPPGEAQPLLPGTEGVREQEIPTPQLEAPFSLTPEVIEPGAVQESLFNKFLRSDEGSAYPLGQNPRDLLRRFIQEESGAIRNPFWRPPQQDVPLRGMDVLDAARAHEPNRTLQMINRASEVPTNLLRAYYDHFIDVRRVMNDMRKRGIAVPPEEDSWVLMNLVAGGTGGPIQAAMLDMLDIRKAAAREGLQTLVTRLLDNRGWDRALTIVEEHMQDAFAREMAKPAHLRNFAEVNRIRQSIANKEIVPLGKDRAELAADLGTLQAHPAYPQVEAYARRVWDLNRRYWDMAHQPGQFGQSLISDAVYQQGLSRGPEYVPLERILNVVDHDPDWIGGGALDLKQRTFLQKLEGSQLATRDPWEASWLYQSRVIKELGRNEVGASVANWRTLDPTGLGSLVVPLPGQMRPPAGYDAIGYYVGGQKQRVAVPSNLANVLRLAGPTSVQLLGQTGLSFGSHALHAGAITWNTAWALRNIFRDMSYLRDISKAVDFYGRNPVKEYGNLAKTWMQSLYSVLKQDQVYREVLRSRSLYGTIGKAIDPKLQLYFDRPLTQTLNPITWLNLLSNVSDETTKVAGYQLLRQKGMREIPAALETRRYTGTPDAAAGGSKSDLANSILMFFKTNVQGSGRTIERGREMPRRFLAIAAEATLLGLALWEWNSQFRDDDGDMAIDKTAPDERERNYVIMTPFEYTTAAGERTHFGITIPKGFVRQSIANPIEKVISLALGSQAVDDLGQVALDTATAPLPGNIRLQRGDMARTLGLSFLANSNPVIGLPIELLGNVDPWRRIPIYPRREEGVSPMQQYGLGTSPIARELGQTKVGQVFGGPRSVEYAIGRVGAGVAQTMLQAADVVLMGRSNLVPLEGLGRIMQLPGVSGFTTSPRNAMLEKREDDFFNLLGDAREVARTYTYRARQPGPGQLDAANDYLNAEPRRMMLLQMAPGLEQVSRQLSDVRQQTAFVIADDSMAPDVKRQNLMELRQVYKDTLANVLTVIQDIQTSQMPPPTGPVPAGPPTVAP
jgi:hypothetical protein